MDEDGSGSLTKEEFIEAAKSEEMKKRFSKIMRELREDKRTRECNTKIENELKLKTKQNSVIWDSKRKYIPIRFDDMLQYLSKNIKRVSLNDEISDQTCRNNKNLFKAQNFQKRVWKDYSNFLMLFEDAGYISTSEKDEKVRIL